MLASSLGMDGCSGWSDLIAGGFEDSAYTMRMARVNITMPDDLYGDARQAGLNVSQLAQRAVAAELERLSKVAELDAYLREIEAEQGPTSEEDRAEARAWADQALGSSPRRRSA
jgi:post-segregation antitoxin (ccd killing protein)